MTKLTKQDLALVFIALRKYASEAKRKEKGYRVKYPDNADEWKKEHEAAVSLIDKITHMRSEIEQEEVERFFG